MIWNDPLWLIDQPLALMEGGLRSNEETRPSFDATYASIGCYQHFSSTIISVFAFRLAVGWWLNSQTTLSILWTATVTAAYDHTLPHTASDWCTNILHQMCFINIVVLLCWYCVYVHCEYCVLIHTQPNTTRPQCKTTIQHVYSVL